MFEKKMKRQKYKDGIEVHAGDRVFYCGQAGMVVFVVDHDEYTPEYPKEEWDFIKTGFMILLENGARLHLECPDEHFSRSKEESMG